MSDPATHRKASGLNLVLGEVKESFLMAMNAVTTHKLRSALTLVGVSVGVFSIIVVMTAMRAAQANIEREMSQLGSYTFQVQKWPEVYFGGPEGFEKFWRRKNITYAQGVMLRDRATMAKAVGMEADLADGEVVSRYAQAPPAPLMGATPGVFPARNRVIAEGRPILESDIDQSRDVCVLGATLSKALFPFGSPLGERIKLDGYNYTVVGVVEQKGASAGSSDNYAMIPLSTGLNRYGRLWRSISILIQAYDEASFGDTMEQVRGILRTVRKVPPGKEDDFELFSNDSLISQFKSFTFSVRIGMAVVSSIALLAAGIGIMNIMLVSVTERTREIGIRRAIGAKKRNIMTQFIMEAITLCEVGGVLGVIAGVASGNGVALYLEVTPVLPVDWIIFGLVICSVVGIVFGTYPAYKAANLDPIESLRYE
ncbi:MAG TPA: ABC transporter permease [Verrucomicrobiae bacterium]|nr:ABC transporter permease [Verrucomicrobiae bacterium]